MIDKSEQRKRILDFFSNNKLNCNCYKIGYYINRDAVDVYEYLLSYFDYHPILKDTSLAQKLYHIKTDCDVIPPHEFINCVEGYRKGGRRGKGDPRWSTSPSSKNAKVFFSKLKQVEYTTSIDNHYVYEEMCNVLRTLFKKIRYDDILNDKKLVNSIHFYKNDTPFENFILEIVYGGNVKCSICSNPTKIYSWRLQDTCGDKLCVSQNLSNKAKVRDFTILHQKECRNKSVETRKNRGYWHTDDTKDKIKKGNIKTWTPKKRKELVDNNRKNGIYEKFSESMKSKILNGDFTPRSSNRLNHKRLASTLTGISNYRSSWELKFHEKNPHLKYETIRIPYTLNEIRYVYIVDFVDDESKVLYEIKPHSLKESMKVKVKENAAILWCECNGYKYNIITENEFDFK